MVNLFLMSSACRRAIFRRECERMESSSIDQKNDNDVTTLEWFHRPPSHGPWLLSTFRVLARLWLNVNFLILIYWSFKYEYNKHHKAIISCNLFDSKKSISKVKKWTTKKLKNLKLILLWLAIPTQVRRA